MTLTPVRILHVDKEREFIVIDKPGSIVRETFTLYLAGTQRTSHSPYMPLAGTTRTAS